MKKLFDPATCFFHDFEEITYVEGEDGEISEVKLDIPEGLIEVSPKRFQELMDGQTEGRPVGADSKGKPVNLDAPKPSPEDIESMRRKAYADPVSGSDRLFSEATRMQMMSEEGWEQIRDQGIARYNEIKTQYPL